MVCVLRMFFWASSNFQSYWYLDKHVLGHVHWMEWEQTEALQGRLWRYLYKLHISNLHIFKQYRYLDLGTSIIHMCVEVWSIGVADKNERFVSFMAIIKCLETKRKKFYFTVSDKLMPLNHCLNINIW